MAAAGSPGAMRTPGASEGTAASYPDVYHEAAERKEN